MSSLASISPEKLSRLVGTPRCPLLIDVRIQDDFAAGPRLIPGSLRRSHESVDTWGAALDGRNAVVICQQGRKLSEGVAAWLRHAGVAAEILDGGFAAWTEAGLPTVTDAVIPPRDAQGRTVWVTRGRPKIDRLACPWLIRRFVDPRAVFLFVAPSEVEAVAERFGAAAFDIEGAFWSHRGELCTFDVMLAEFGLATEPLGRLATIVRGADTARLDLAPESAGLLAVSLGLSRMYPDDLAQLEAALGVYDAFYRWSRDATDEPHDWPPRRPGARP
jgi:rhodanese-related sulfurtransferase